MLSNRSIISCISSNTRRHSRWKKNTIVASPSIFIQSTDLSAKQISFRFFFFLSNGIIVFVQRDLCLAFKRRKIAWKTSKTRGNVSFWKSIDDRRSIRRLEGRESLIKHESITRLSVAKKKTLDSSKS